MKVARKFVVKCCCLKAEVSRFICVRKSRRSFLAGILLSIIANFVLLCLVCLLISESLNAHHHGRAGPLCYLHSQTVQASSTTAATDTTTTMIICRAKVK